MKKIISRITTLTFILMFCISSWKIYLYYKDDFAKNKEFEELIKFVKRDLNNTNKLENTSVENNKNKNQINTRDINITMSSSKNKNNFNLLQDISSDNIRTLYEKNNDLIGWIKIDNTRINYPVMQSKDNSNYYLNHSFYKSISSHGVPYVDSKCDLSLPSDNIIIYGHHLRSGSMFSDLMKFEKKSFFDKNKSIRFNTLDENGTYRIIAVFKTSVNNNSTKDFSYYSFVNADNENEFNDFVIQCKRKSLYDTGSTAKYGDKLITLSTCEYSQKNGRMVIVAKKI